MKKSSCYRKFAYAEYSIFTNKGKRFPKTFMFFLRIKPPVTKVHIEQICCPYYIEYENDDNESVISTFAFCILKQKERHCPYKYGKSKKMKSKIEFFKYQQHKQRKNC